MDIIWSSAKNEVAIGLDLKSTTGADSPCVSCVGGKLARHTFPDQGSDADDVLAVVHIDLCGPFRVAAKDGSLYFLLLRDRKSRFVWVRPVAKKSDVLLEFQRWLVLVERWGLHLGVSGESKGWELLDIDANRVATTSDKVFYEDISLEVWKSENGPVSGRTPTTSPTVTSTATLPLLAEVGELADEDAEVVRPPSPSPTIPPPPLVADLHGLTPMSASGNEGSSGTSPSPPAKGLAGGRRDERQVDVGLKPTLLGEEQVEEKSTEVQQGDEGSEAGDEGEKSTDSDVVEVWPEPRKSGRLRRPPDFFVPAAFTTVYDVEDDDDLAYDDAEEDEEFPELDLDMLANLEHRWDISTMTVKEALASWKGPVVKAAMEEEIRNLINMGTWELVERPPGVNIMKNRWVLMTKYHVEDTVEREKARLVVKGFTQVYGADYDKTLT
ncbi:unnamed protein product [Closterium sp. Naga37s-1]|nr:unnamed protein product [Closterium sp. Naga37s-1]